MVNKMIQLVQETMEFAIKSHEGQFRKYGPKVPYIRHPQVVAALVTLYNGVTDEEVGAAWVHDTVEDCGVSIVEIQRRFGKIVAGYVWGLTNEFSRQSYPGLNRATRHQMENDRIAKLDERTLRIKLVDRFANINDCLRYEDTPLDFKSLMYNETKDMLDKVEHCCMGNEILEDIYISLCSVHSRLSLDLNIAQKSRVNTSLTDGG